VRTNATLAESHQEDKDRIQELQLLLERKEQEYTERLLQLEQTHGEASLKLMREYEMKLQRHESNQSLTSLQIENNESIPNSPTSQPSPAITPSVPFSHVGIRINSSQESCQFNLFQFTISVEAI
jgi:hypothetical protein